MLPKAQHNGCPFPHISRFLVTGSNPSPRMGWNKWHPTTFSGEALSCAVGVPWSIASDGCINTKGDQRSPKGQADEMVSTTKCSPDPRTTAAPQAQQCPSAGLTNPGCSWPKAVETPAHCLWATRSYHPTSCCSVSTSALNSERGIFRTVSVLALDHISQAGDSVRQWYSWVY